MIRIRDISLPAREDGPEALKLAAARALGAGAGDIGTLKIRRRSVDARHRGDVRVIYTVDLAVPGEEALLRRASGGKIGPARSERYTPPSLGREPELRPVIAGFGPAGMFAGLVLAMAGARPLILERGRDVDTRAADVERFWGGGAPDPASNVQFGEGGAGAFSDGKLNTGIKNPRVQWVLDRFVEFGAGESVAYDAKPHVGTDKLRLVVKNLRQRITRLGGEVRFESAVTGVDIRRGRVTGVTVNGGESVPCRELILAVGHSARDTFQLLEGLGVPMEPKAFAMGVRIEHLQRDIDRAQYGEFAGIASLGAADYKLVAHTPRGTVYTFCMCPGGYVVAAASETGGVVTNGMSCSPRDGENANSALLTGLSPEQFPFRGPLGGMFWQRELEQRAFRLAGGTYAAPAQTVGSFLGRPHEPSLAPSYRPGVRYTDLHRLLPREIAEPLALALPELGRRLAGFDHPGSVMTGPETRSSSPVRILRGENRQSAVAGLYPCGEGAGYAGGITSAAVDGMLTAEAVLASLSDLT